MNEEEPGANEARMRKLRRQDLARLARKRGLELRHSDYGYSLIDLAKNRIEGRNDLTLDEVNDHLTRQG